MVAVFCYGNTQTGRRKASSYGIGTKKDVKYNGGEAVSFPSISERKPEPASALVEGFLEYARYECNFSPQTIIKYKDALRSFIRDIGDKPVETLDVQDFVRLKRIMMERGVSPARISSVIYAMRSFLSYCRDFLNISTLPAKTNPTSKDIQEGGHISDQGGD